MTISTVVQTGAVGIVSTVLLAFGGTVIATKMQAAVQATQIVALQQHQLDEDKTLHHLDESVQALDKSVAVLSDRLNHGKSH